MSQPNLRIQFISDTEGIDALTRAAAAESVTTEPHEIPASDQRFGIVEAAAIIAIVHTAAQIAQLLVKAYKELKGTKKITVKTPKGSVTIEGDSSMSTRDFLKQVEDAGIV